MRLQRYLDEKSDDFRRLNITFHPKAIFSLLVFLYAVCVTQTASAQSAVELISVSANQTSGNSNSFNAALSADGRFVAFASNSSNLVANDTNNASDIFVRDRQTGSTILASINRSGTASGNGISELPAISADGRFVVFISAATDLVGGNLSGLFVRDLQMNTTTLVSRNRSNSPSGNGTISTQSPPVITPDGRFILFSSGDDDLVANDANNRRDVFVYDRQQGTTTLVSVNQSNTASANSDSFFASSITPDGRYVVFESSASDLVPANVGDSPFRLNVFVRDLQAATTTLASISSDGNAGGNGASFSFRRNISTDGRFVTFASRAANLVNGSDTNNGFDVFVRDLQAGTTALVSLTRDAGVNAGAGESFEPSISDDGRFIAFSSDAPNLVASDTNNSIDVFLRDLQTGTTTLVSRNNDGQNSGNAISDSPLITRDGSFVVFESAAGDLTAINDTNNARDIFRFDRQSNATTLISRNDDAGDNSANDASFNPLPTPDGLFIAFESLAGNLAAGDINGLADVFVSTPAQASSSQFRFGSASSFRVGEAVGSTTVTVTLGGNPNNTATVDYATSDGSAVAGSDYAAVSGTLVFNPGETSKSFTVPIIDDTINEADETINLTLSNPTGGATLGSPQTLPLTITDNDALPALSINDVSVLEGSNGTLPLAVFTVSLSSPSGRTVTTNFSTSSSSALFMDDADSPGDYQETSGTLTFAPGQTTQTVNIQINGDNTPENDETFRVILGDNPSFAVVSDGIGIGTILNDDGAPTRISINDITVTEPLSNSAPTVFTVSLSAPNNQQVTVNYATSGGTATAGADFQDTFGMLTFPAGTTSQTFIVLINADRINEANETFFINLGNPTNAVIGDGRSQATIINRPGKRRRFAGRSGR